jgi:alpha-tubulin suppressor-like RCC1 family protein
LIQFFEGKKLRSLSFGKTHAAAIDAQGNLVQWGNLKFGEPSITLKGKNLVQVVCTDDRVFALAQNGTVYQVSQSELQNNRWVCAEQSRIYLPSTSGWFEKITSITAGSQFIVGLSSSGKAFEYQIDALNNYGLAERTARWKAIDVDGGRTIKQIATGTNHALLLTADGLVFGKGWNRYGQLGLTDRDIGVTFDRLKEMDVKLGRGDEVKSIAAGGDTSFVVVQSNESQQVFSCGNGQYGQLGAGGFYHAQGILKSVRNLSQLQEYNEQKNKMTSIPIDALHVSSSHCCAVLGSAEQTQYGRDVYMWGQKEALLRLDGKQANTPIPMYSKPLFPMLSNERLQLASGQTVALGHNITAVYFNK